MADNLETNLVDSDVKVSFTILTHNEDTTLQALLDQLFASKTLFDEIVIVDDFSTNKATTDILLDAQTKGARVFRNSLNGDFAQQKNFIQAECKNEYIFNIDADELLDPKLMKTFREIIVLNKDVEVYRIPRVNKVKGLTLKHIEKWRWQITKMVTEIEDKVLDPFSDEYILIKGFGLIITEDKVEDQSKPRNVKFFTPIINWPDLQNRIYKNNGVIKWTNKVHEMPVGYKTFAQFPLDKSYAILHYKEIERQEKQNEYYSTLQR